jgi:predicted nucleotidyltransferase
VTAELRSERFQAIIRALRLAAPGLRDAGVRFALGGSMACWAHGGPPTDNDLDFVVLPEEARAAQAALEGVGMVPEEPPEEWLVKARFEEVVVDLIFRLVDRDVDAALLERAPRMKVQAITMPVLRVEDVLTTKLKALGEHDLDLAPLLQIARSLREKVDWQEVGLATGSSPYARAFLALVGELEVIPSGVLTAVRA